MSRQESLNTIWKRLLIVLSVSLTACLCVIFLIDEPRVAALLFLVGNIGGYVSVHRSLGELTDSEVSGIASSWWALIAPSFVGGILAIAMYLLFLSNILSGELFPRFLPDEGAPKDVGMLMAQHADSVASYGKLLFWGFIAGFNQKYVVDIISSIKPKP